MVERRSPRSHRRSRTLSSLISFEAQQDMIPSPPSTTPMRIVNLPKSQSLDPNDSGVAFHELDLPPVPIYDVRTSCCYASQAFAVLSPCQHSACRDCFTEIIKSVQTDQATHLKTFTCYCGQRLQHLEALHYDPVVRLHQLLRSRQPPELFSTSIDVPDGRRDVSFPHVALPSLVDAPADLVETPSHSKQIYLDPDCFINCRFPIVRLQGLPELVCTRDIEHYLSPLGRCMLPDKVAYGPSIHLLPSSHLTNGSTAYIEVSTMEVAHSVLDCNQPLLGCKLAVSITSAEEMMAALFPESFHCLSRNEPISNVSRDIARIIQECERAAARQTDLPKRTLTTLVSMIAKYPWQIPQFASITSHQKTAQGVMILLKLLSAASITFSRAEALNSMYELIHVSCLRGVFEPAQGALCAGWWRAQCLPEANYCHDDHVQANQPEPVPLSSSATREQSLTMLDHQLPSFPSFPNPSWPQQSAPVIPNRPPHLPMPYSAVVTQRPPSSSVAPPAPQLHRPIPIRPRSELPPAFVPRHRQLNSLEQLQQVASRPLGMSLGLVAQQPLSGPREQLPSDSSAKG